jgi:hypothetical protein
MYQMNKVLITEQENLEKEQSKHAASNHIALRIEENQQQS